MPTMLATSGAAARSSDLPGELLPVLAALLGLVIVGGIVVYIVRRMAVRESDGGPAGFTLQDLRDLHRAGGLTDEEFDRAKTAMISAIRRPREDAKAPRDLSGDDGTSA